MSQKIEQVTLNKAFSSKKILLNQIQEPRYNNHMKNASLIEKEILRGKLYNMVNSSIIMSKEKVELLNRNFSYEARKNKNEIIFPKISHRYEDYYITPREIIQKNFTEREAKIILSNPNYFKLNIGKLKDKQLLGSIHLKDTLNQEEKNILLKKLKKNKKIKKIKSNSLQKINLSTNNEKIPKKEEFGNVNTNITFLTSKIKKNRNVLKYHLNLKKLTEKDNNTHNIYNRTHSSKFCLSERKDDKKISKFELFEKRKESIEAENRRNYRQISLENEIKQKVKEKQSKLLLKEKKFVQSVLDTLISNYKSNTINQN